MIILCLTQSKSFFDGGSLSEVISQFSNELLLLLLPFNNIQSLYYIIYFCLLLSNLYFLRSKILITLRVRSSARMEASGGNSDAYRGSSLATSGNNNNSTRYGMQLSASNFFHSPLSTLLDYTGILRTRSSSSSSHAESDSLMNSSPSAGYRDQSQPRLDDSDAAGNDGEVSIRIIGSEQEHDRVGIVLPSPTASQNEVFVQPLARTASATSLSSALEDSRSDRGDVGMMNGSGGDAEAGDGVGVNNRDSSYQRYDIQQAARWIEQVLPFSLLLLVVFIRQHLQGII